MYPAYYRNEEESWYDTAEICINGHIINAYAKSSPERSEKFCRRCGAQTIRECQNCKSMIRGYHHVPHITSIGFKLPLPAYCVECGKAYPWTEKKITAANELAKEFEEFTEEDKNVLNRSIPDILSETPSTQVATIRIKKIISKGGPLALQMFREIFVDVVSESVKKAIWGN